MTNKDSKYNSNQTPSPLERAGVRLKSGVRLKICGMKYPDNILAVAALKPDYLGFIFYEKSLRNFTLNSIPEISKNIKKTGVFVNSSLEFVIEKINTFGFEAVQLHGEETLGFCKLLKQNNKTLEIIKVFSINDTFNFDILKPYENIVDYFLFDTQGKLPGGNGFTFNWNVLENYPSTKPFFLSGGIGLEQVVDLKEFLNSGASKYCYAIDVNSKFEVEPGLKNIELLNEFKKRFLPSQE